MKKILTIATSLALAAGASAQSYDKMWKAVKQQAEQDLPQSALKGVEEIRDKAAMENNSVQLLRAILMLRVYSAEVSPDSAQVYVSQIEEALATEQDAIQKALYHSALAQCYESMEADDDITYAENKKQVKTHFEASLADMEVLANVRLQQYLPLMHYEADSKYFNDDLLHVMLSAYVCKGKLRTQEQIDWLVRVIDFYRQRGAFDAATLLALQHYHLTRKGKVSGLIEQNEDYITLTTLLHNKLSTEVALRVYDELVALQDDYSQDKSYAAHNDSVLVDWAERGIQAYGKDKKLKACNTLRNFMQSMTNPTAELKEVKASYGTGQHLQLALKVRNLKRATVRIVRLFDTQLDYRKVEDNIDFKKKASFIKKAEVETVRNFNPQSEYAWLADSVSLTLPTKSGIYWLELQGNGKHLDGCVVTISDYAAIKLATPAGSNRITVVNRATGRPVSNAVVTAYAGRYDKNRWGQVRSYQTDSHGQVTVVDNKRMNLYYGIKVGQDAAAEFFTLDNINYYTDEEQARTIVQLYTDRGIYRPGQQVEFTGVAFTHTGDKYRVVGNYKATVELRNVNGKLVDSVAVRTDAMGSFSGSFTLPKQGLTGNYSLRLTQCSASAYHQLKVEEYKRPTFTATTRPVTVAYALGDTVKVEGEAKTYSGVSVPRARVQYTVQRSAWFFWNDDEFEPQTGETTTDDGGRFSLPIHLAKAYDSEHEGGYNRYTYTVSYTVTAENGETSQGSHALTVATRPTWLTADVPTTIYRRGGKALPLFTITQVNASGQAMKAQGIYQVLCGEQVVAEGTFEGGIPFTVTDLATLPSAAYTLRYYTPQAEGDSLSFLLFSDEDKKPIDQTKPFFSYTETDKASGAVDLIVGSPCHDAVLYYDVVANGRVVESQQLTLNNELRRFHIDYQPTYGDGAKVLVALFRDGKLYTDEAEVVKPLPNKQLTLQWKTFRSRLTPGQQEEWVLQVTHPDGMPAKAQLAACMYDASLDAFVNNRWDSFAVNFTRNLPRAWWKSSVSDYSRMIKGDFRYYYLPTSVMNFTKWDDTLFDYYMLGRYSHILTESAVPVGGPVRYMRSMALADANSDAAEDGRMYKNASKEASTPLAPPMNMGTSASNMVTPRTNFAETAFFRPNLRTNEAGEVSISFTLPESMTQWNFCALAHTQRMDYGRIDTTIVARKDFMVEPAMPRFLRRGDKAELPVKVTNLSDKPIKAQLQLTLLDALTEKQQYNVTQYIALGVGETKVFTFAYDARQAEGVMICRTTAQGSGFSDGEEHYLPILTTDVEVTRTLPFSLTQQGTTTFATDTLFNAPHATHRSLSVELSSNPTWYAVTALPALAGSASCVSAVDWATRYYAFTIGQFVTQNNPEVQRLVQKNEKEVDKLAALKTEGLTDATPWLQRAEAEKLRGAALRQLFDEEIAAAQLYTAIDKLKALQKEDGSYCWYPGMNGNALITLEVAQLLARTECLTQRENVRIHAQLSKAFNYLQKDVAEDVRDMKQYEKEHKTQLVPSEYCMRYLYLRTLMGMKFDDDAQYLLNRAVALRHELTMYGKALSVIIFDKNGKSAEATLALKSLKEHTVCSPEMGRYFDTPRAEWSWRSYRIPSQCAAIEALHYVNDEATANEMRLWLLQAKRTQMWETARATSDAVYALLMSSDTTTVMPLSTQTPLYYTLYNKKRIVGQNAPSDSEKPTTVGYVKQTYTDNQSVEATSLKVDKRSDGLSWGAVYASFMAPIEEVTTEGKGLQITRRLERKQGMEWVDLTDASLLQKGDRVRQVFTLVADRDYDFVSLSADHAANMQPVHPLSGYAWNTVLPAYRAVHDASTDYFIEQLRKGKHQFAEEFFVDRTGRFSNGVARIQCVYAPEFQGMTK